MDMDSCGRLRAAVSRNGLNVLLMLEEERPVGQLREGHFFVQRLQRHTPMMKDLDPVNQLAGGWSLAQPAHRAKLLQPANCISYKRIVQAEAGRIDFDDLE